MAVWKQRGRGNRHPSHAPLGHDPAELDRLVDLLAAKPEDKELRRQLGDAMEAADVDSHRGWVAEHKVVNAKTVPGKEAEAAAWLTARGLRVPKGRHAPKVLAREIQRHAVGNDWPPRDVFEWDVVWTARPSRGDDSV